MLRDVEKWEAKIVPMYPEGTYKWMKEEQLPQERRFVFWQQWLFLSSLAFACFGAALAIDGHNWLFDHYYTMVANQLWNKNALPLEVEQFRGFIVGPLGGTIAAFYLLVAGIAWFPFRKREVWARNMLLIAFLVWGFIDTAICLHHHLYVQAFVINGFSLLMKALPLYFTWEDFD